MLISDEKTFTAIDSMTVDCRPGSPGKRLTRGEETKKIYPVLAAAGEKVR
jgi:hypothetical protein